MKKEEYYKMPFNLCVILGLNFGKFENHGGWILLRILKVVAFLNIVFTIIQELLYFADGSNPPGERLRIVAFISYMFEAFIKISSATIQEEKIIEVINNIEDIRHKMSSKQQSMLDASAQRLRDLSNLVGTSYIILIQMFNILPALIMLKMYFMNEEMVFLHPFPFWYPFDPDNYFKSTYTYEMFCGLMAVIAIAVIDALYLMIVSRIIGIYDVLVASIQDIINLNEVHESDKFKKIIEMHVEVSNQSNILNSCFGVPTFVHIILASIIVCFTSFVASTQKEIMVILQFCSLLLVSLMHTFLFCWFGHQVDEKVSERLKLRNKC